jgi:hypothetical protein
MALKTTPVPRNLGTRVTFLGLEVEDAIAILIIAALANIFGRFAHRELFGIPLNLFLQYVVPVLAIPGLMVFKYGRPRGYLMDFTQYYLRPHVYCALEEDPEQRSAYLKEEEWCL